MQEVYVGDSDAILTTLSGSPDGPVAVAVIDEHTGLSVTGGQALPEGVNEIEVPLYSFVLPRSAASHDRRLRLVYTYTVQAVEQKDEVVVDVVTPYVHLRDVLALYPDLATKSEAELRQGIAVVRGVIDAFTGESFGRFHGSMWVKGGVNNLQLPYRVIQLDSLYLHGQDVIGHYVYSPDQPFILQYSVHDVQGIPTFYDVKSDTYYSRLSWHKSGTFRFQVTGQFGWRSVPREVQLAAQLLVRDFFDNEHAWRERNVKILTMGDTRLEFGGDQRNTTGNVNADLMLEKFRRIKWEVV